MGGTSNLSSLIVLVFFLIYTEGRSRVVLSVAAEVGTRSRLIRLSRSNGQVRCSPPPMVDALRRVRLGRSGTRLWTCCAGRAGTRIRSEALHRILTIGRPAAARAGARPYHCHGQRSRRTIGGGGREKLGSRAG